MTNFIIINQFGFSEYKNRIIEEFSNINEEVKDCEEGIHILTFILAESARKAIKEKDIKYLEKLFSFILELLDINNLESEIENSLYISFLLKEDFKNKEKIWEKVPDKIKSIINQAT